MDTELYKIQQQNFLSIVEYFNKAKEKAENYCTYMQNYKDYTKQYLKKIRKLFIDFSSSLYDKSINPSEDFLILEEEEDMDKDEDILDSNLNKNKINIEKNIIKNDKKITFNLDLSPINKLTNTIYKQFYIQINGLNLFVKGLDLSIDNFKSIINTIKKEKKQLEYNYLDEKQKFLQYAFSYQKENSELLIDYSSVENKLIQFIFLKSNENIIHKKTKNKCKINLDDIENELRIKTNEIKTKEAEFLKKELDKKKMCNDFKEKSDQYIKDINDNIILIINNLKSNIEKFLFYYLNCYHLNFKELYPNIKQFQKMNNQTEYEKFIKQIIKQINDNIMTQSYEHYNPINYNIKIIKNKNLDEKFYENLIKNGYDIKRDNFELDANNVYFVVKKMLQFTFVSFDKENYDVNKEDNKRLIKKYFNLMFDSKEANQKKISKKEQIKLYSLIENDKNLQLYSLEILSEKEQQAFLNYQKKCLK